MAKYICPPLFAYVFVCTVCVLAPASDGYDIWTWKLYLGQYFAIPFALFVFLTAVFLEKTSEKRKKKKRLKKTK